MSDRLFYVTVRDNGRIGFLLGPYSTHAEALANVDRGRQLAYDANVWSCFYSFGTTSLSASVKQPLPIFRKEVANV